MSTTSPILGLTLVASGDNVAAGAALNANFAVLDARAAQVFNAKDDAYGALGDGVTDDTAALQAALDAAGSYAAAHGGAVVVIPPGQYLTAAATSLAVKSGVTIWAYGAYLFKGGTPSAGLVRNFLGTDSFAGYTGNSHIKILGGIWDGKGQNAAASAEYDILEFCHCTDIEVRDVTVRNAASAHALEFNSTNGAAAVNCRFEGFVDTTGGSRTFSEALQIDVAVSGSSSLGPFDGTHAKNILVSGCYMGPAIDGSGLGSFGKLVGSHTTSSGAFYDKISIVGNIVDGSLDVGIQAYNWCNSIIADNIITGAGTFGISVTVPDPGVVSFSVLSVGVLVTGNTINSPGSSGISAVGYTSTAGVADLQISGNTVRNTGSAGVVVTLLTAPVVIVDNLIDTTASNGISVQGVVQVLISGNSARFPATNYPIFLGQSGSTSSTDCNVNGNYCALGSGATAGIRISTGTSLCLVSGNTVRKAGGSQTIAVSCAAGAGITNTVDGNDLAGFGDATATITVSSGTINKSFPATTNIGRNIG